MHLQINFNMNVFVGCALTVIELLPIITHFASVTRTCGWHRLRDDDSSAGTGEWCHVSWRASRGCIKMETGADKFA